MEVTKKKAMTNAEKQKTIPRTTKRTRYAGNAWLLSPEALECYQLIAEQTTGLIVLY